MPSAMRPIALIAVPFCAPRSSVSAAPAADLAFKVFRSRMGNLPVYNSLRLNGTRKVTVVRKFVGDRGALAAEMERVCETKATHYHGRIELKGHHGQRLRRWLEELGF